MYNNTWGLHTCSHWEDAGVTCFKCPACPAEGTPRLAANATSPAAADVPLANGTQAPAWAAGRMEVWHNLNWGTVCGDWFHRVDADVACRSLGFHAGCVVDPAEVAAARAGGGPEPQCGGDGVAANFTVPAAEWPNATSIWLDNVVRRGQDGSGQGRQGSSLWGGGGEWVRKGRRKGGS